LEHAIDEMKKTKSKAKHEDVGAYTTL